MIKPGPHNALTDIPGLAIGCAHDSVIRTGVTIVRAEGLIPAGLAVLGGGPGGREFEALAPENLVGGVNAIVLAGGSVYGLAAADAVTAALGAQKQGFALRPGPPVSPIVAAAILYDLANGGDKDWALSPPYHALGAQALAACGPAAPQGNAGAGYGALAGALKGGQGHASYVAEDGAIIAALAVVNCFGSVLAPGGKSFWAAPLAFDGELGAAPPPSAGFDAADWGASKLAAAAVRANTSLAIVATDLAFTTAECKRLAHMAAAGFARAIRPVFAPFDGDVVFALSAGDRPPPEPRALSLARIGALAADCLSRAVARGVYAAESLGEHVAYRDL